MAVPSVTAVSVLDSFVGSYELEGIGEMTLARRGAFLHAAGVRVGLAMPWEKRLVVAFGPLNQVEIGVYKVGPKVVTGLWVPPGADQADYSACGVEESVPGIDGEWRISKAFAIDKSTYTGKVSRDVMHGTDPAGKPRAVHMLWRLEDGEFRSFGLDYGDALYSTFCFTPEEPYGVAVYEKKGNEWVGASLNSQGRGITPERLLPKA